MSGNIKIEVSIPPDEKGMVGRECPKCKLYFKVKLGTGISTKFCNCPYCEYSGDSDNFMTKSQLEYAQSIAINQLLNDHVSPSLEKLTKQFKALERGSRNSLIKIKIHTKVPNLTLPIKHYTEYELETSIICDNCGLEFSIYGVFSKCPDCSRTNAFLIYNKSLEVTQRRLEIFSKPEIPDDIKELSLNTTLTSTISAFDGLGKELRKRNRERFPSKPKNLFQNITLLDEKLERIISTKHSNFAKLHKFFQLRHILEHNMGVVDQDFIRKLPSYSSMLGRKYTLTIKETQEFLNMMTELGQIIQEHLEE